MDRAEIKQLASEIASEAIKEIQAPPKRPKSNKKKVEFSKKLMYFASLIYAAILAVTVYSWFDFQSVPRELLQYASWLYGATIVSYNCKSAYENKAKIEKWGGEE